MLEGLSGSGGQRKDVALWERTWCFQTLLMLVTKNQNISASAALILLVASLFWICMFQLTFLFMGYYCTYTR